MKAREASYLAPHFLQPLFQFRIGDFAVVGEEMGFVGVVLTLGLMGFIIFRSIYNAQTARDNLGLFIVMGIVGIYFFHLIVNVGMVIGFMPTTGIPLPFLKSWPFAS